MNTQAYLPGKNRRITESAFSLVEVMVVMAVISILVAVAVPIFSNSSGSARQASVEIIKANIRQARAHSISTGAYTAITIPSIQSGVDRGLRSMALFEVELKDGAFKPRTDSQNNQIQLQAPSVLPGNYHFVPQSMVSSAKPTVIDSPITMVTNYRNLEQTTHIIVFAPNGQIVSPPLGTAVQIAIAKAAKDGNSLKITEKSDGRAIFELIQVNHLTGKTRFVQP